MMPMQAEIQRANLKTPYDMANFREMLRGCFDLQLTPVDVNGKGGAETLKRGHFYKIKRLNLPKKVNLEQKGSTA